MKKSLFLRLVTDVEALANTSPDLAYGFLARSGELRVSLVKASNEDIADFIILLVKLLGGNREEVSSLLKAADKRIIEASPLVEGHTHDREEMLKHLRDASSGVGEGNAD